MKNRKRFVSIMAGIMAALMLLTLILGLLPTPVHAASSSEIRKQINHLKEEKEEIKEKIKEVQAQFEENENEIVNIIAKKNIIDQEVQLLTTQIVNMNAQLSAYNILIADKQDELDHAEDRYVQLNEDNKLRIRAMEEEGELSYWEVLFKANSFSDLLDRLNIVEEIAVSDNRRLQELSDAADAVEVAQVDLVDEKAEMEEAKKELDATEAELADKRAQADALLQELLTKADDLEALEAEFEAQEAEFLEMIAQKEVEFDEAKQREWEAYMATYVPPTTAPLPVYGGDGGSGGTNGNGGGSGGGGTVSTPSGGGGWIWPTTTRRVSSPFGNRVSPTNGASTYHQGIDIDGNTGDPVWAARAGIVISAGWSNKAGNNVLIDHQDGYRSIYMHLNSISTRVGAVVGAGTSIGTMGSTGVSTGDHLHFGISHNGVYVNPAAYVS